MAPSNQEEPPSDEDSRVLPPRGRPAAEAAPAGDDDKTSPPAALARTDPWATTREEELQALYEALGDRLDELWSKFRAVDKAGDGKTADGDRPRGEDLLEQVERLISRMLDAVATHDCLDIQQLVADAGWLKVKMVKMVYDDPDSQPYIDGLSEAREHMVEYNIFDAKAVNEGIALVDEELPTTDRVPASVRPEHREAWVELFRARKEADKEWIRFFERYGLPVRRSRPRRATSAVPEAGGQGEEEGGGRGLIGDP